MGDRHRNLRALLKGRWTSPSKYRLVEVLWWDAVGVTADDWGAHEDAYNAAPVKTLTLGYIVKDTSDYITIVGLINEHHLSHGICIPKTMIHEIRELKVK